jgi:hypothetical protein
MQDLNGIKKDVTYGNITIDEVSPGNFAKKDKNGKEILTARLRQIVTTVTTYPSAQVSDELSDNLFATEDFNLGDGQEFTNLETRICFLKVPAECTVQQLEMMFKNLKEEGKKPCIVKMLSNEPILEKRHMRSIDIGQRTKEQYAESQVVRRGKNSSNPGEIILDSFGNPMYKVTFFSKDKRADINNCGSSEVYIPESLQEEISEVTTQNEEVESLF